MSSLISQISVYTALGLGGAVFLKILSKIQGYISYQRKVKNWRADSQQQAERKRKERAEAIEEVKLPHIPEAAFEALNNATIR